jgi:ElaB/YqjD/DUF883 family membrane-anchored ribosome-binding protein
VKNDETRSPDDSLTPPTNGSDPDTAQEQQSDPQPLVQEAQAAIDEQRNQTADALQSFADTIQEKAGTIPGGDHDLAGAAAAQQVERVADFVHERNLTNVVGSVQTYLRRQPLVGVVSGIAIGFVIGKLWK